MSYFAYAGRVDCQFEGALFLEGGVSIGSNSRGLTRWLWNNRVWLKYISNTKVPINRKQYKKEWIIWAEIPRTTFKTQQDRTQKDTVIHGWLKTNSTILLENAHLKYERTNWKTADSFS